MAYATLQDLIDRFGQNELIQRTDRTNKPASTIDQIVVQRALDDATALINGYLAKLYTLPVSPVPDVLVKVTADVARYYLHGSAVDKDGPVAAAHAQGLKWLRDVSTGLVQLETAGVAMPQAGGGQVRTSGPDRVMTRDSLRGL